MIAAIRRREFPGGWLGSAALHAALLAAALIAWPKSEMQSGTVVPVKILTNAPQTNLRPAIEAPEVQTAQAEDPVPDAPMETVSPAPTPAPPAPPPPQPQPQPPRPAPKAAPTPAPKTPAPKAAPTPAPKTPAPKAAPTPAPKTPAAKAAPQRPAPAAAAQKSAPALDLAELRRSLGVQPSGGRRSSAPKGENRPETDRQARPDAGAGLSASSIPGLQEQLSELWNPNCQVQGGRAARVTVTFVVGAGGKLVGRPEAGGQEFTTGVPRVAAERAIDALQIAEDRGHLAMVPRSLHGKKITARFDPSQCS